MPVYQLNVRRCEILQKQCSGTVLSMSDHDPRQPEDPRLCEYATEKITLRLIQFNQHCAF